VSLRTRYEFTLPRGYVDRSGTVHRDGVMRLATARDELEPLRDPTVSGPDDPRLTIVVLARVVEQLGTLDQVTPHEIEGLFAADLAYLQDFYGVVNFGTQEEFEEFVAARQELGLVTDQPAQHQPPQDQPAPVPEAGAGDESGDGTTARSEVPVTRLGRAAIEEITAEAR
jgi:hypothetical protein